MANVYVEARPKGRPEGSAIQDYVVEDHANHELGTFKTQKEAIDWAKAKGHAPLVARPLAVGLGLSRRGFLSSLGHITPVAEVWQLFRTGRRGRGRYPTRGSFRVVRDTDGARQSFPWPLTRYPSGRGCEHGIWRRGTILFH